MEKGLIRKTEGNIPFYIGRSLEETHLVRHGFSTRLGGVSEGVYASLNLGRSVPDETANIRENKRRFCGAVGVDAAELRFAKQIHGEEIFLVKTPDDRVPHGETRDGFITNLPGVPLMVFTADCVPVLLLDPAKKVITAVHCGWRGTSLDIAGKAVRTMREEYGCDPSDFIAVIGPSIMPCHFLTDSDVPDAMTARFGESVSPYIEKRGEKWAVDLPGINSHALMREGVSENKITLSGLCSACRTDEFFSHRIMGFARGVCAAVISL